MNKLITIIITIFTCLSFFGCAESDFEEFDYCDNEDHYCKIKTTNDLEKDVVSITFSTLNYAIDIPTVTHGNMHKPGADWQSCLGYGPTNYKNDYLGPLECTGHRTIAVVNIPIDVNMPQTDEDRYLELKAIYFKDKTVRMEFVPSYYPVFPV